MICGISLTQMTQSVAQKLTSTTRRAGPPW